MKRNASVDSLYNKHAEGAPAPLDSLLAILAVCDELRDQRIVIRGNHAIRVSGRIYPNPNTSGDV